MIELSALSDTVASGAYRALDGEYAWRRADLPGVVQDLVERRLALMGGEVWVVEGSLFCSLSPRKDGGWTVLAWNGPLREQGETWEHYTRRCAEETLRAIHELNAEEAVAPEASDNLYYHIRCAGEHEYHSFSSLVA
jgi:hypothetical protein